MPAEELRTRLRTLRVNTGLSQKRLSESMGYSSGWAAKVETGRIGIGLDDIEKWAEVCGHNALLLLRPSLLSERTTSTVIPTAELSPEEMIALVEAARVFARLEPPMRDIFLRSVQSNNRVWASTITPKE